MTYQLRKTRISHGQTAVYDEKWKPGKGKVGYIRSSTYVKELTTVWAVIDTTRYPNGRSSHPDNFRNGAHAVAWLRTITKPGTTFDDTTWREIHKAAPDTLPTFRKITGQNWHPEATQKGLM